MKMLPLHVIQNQARVWLQHNFPDATPDQQFLGIVEEVGELAHARLKAQQHIRATADELEAKEINAIGDITIFLLGYCNTRGWDFEQIVTETWKEVRARDWTLDPNRKPQDPLEGKRR